jgi:predicted Ser/Thr protein kinase
VRPRHKFNAKRTEYNGRKYASKAEARYAQKLDGMKATGEVLFYLPQVAMPIPGYSRYVCDFLVFYANGECAFIDVKGMVTPMFTLKKKLVEEAYPVTIEIVR